MIYLDHHAASPVGPHVREAMARAAEVAWANPSSIHAAGRAARRVVDRAREQVANALGAQAPDVVFTAGGTEACNLGVFGLARGKRRVVTTAIEHPAVGKAVAALGARGLEVVELPVVGGTPPPADRIAALGGSDTLFALPWINHETGTLFPVEAYALALVGSGASMFVDACQALGKVPMNLQGLGVHAVAVASAKLGGPAGAGALWVARGVDIDPVQLGGAQERGRRAGSLDAVTLAGFGAAAEHASARLLAMPAVAARRDRLEAGLVALGARVHGDRTARAATATNVSFVGWRGEELVAALDVEGVCISAGPACSSGMGEPSPVIAHMHADEPELASRAVRFSLGPSTTDDDVTRALEVLGRVVPRAAT